MSGYGYATVNIINLYCDIYTYIIFGYRYRTYTTGTLVAISYPTGSKLRKASRRELVHHGINKATIFNRQKAYCILVLTFDF